MSEAPALRVFKPGEIIIREGDAGDVAYLILKGKVQAYHEAPSGDIVLNVTGPPRIFGEFALVTDAPRAASVRALEETECLVITRPIIKAAIERSDPLVQSIIHDYIARLKG
jgi:CRP-like cAMP-binding protein